MKTKKNFYAVWGLVFYLFGCAVCVFAGDKMEEEYTVKINGISMCRSSAENVFRYLANNRQEIRDVATGQLVQSVTKYMDVTLENGLIKTISDVYKDCLSQRNDRFKVLINGDTVCVFSNVTHKINLCVDRNSEVVTKLLILE